MDPTQSGFAHGFGIFETIKLSSGRLCFWEAHRQRLVRSADALGLQFDVSEATLLAAVRELVQADGLSDGTVKVSLLRDGAGSRCYVYSRPSMAATGNARLLLNNEVLLNEHSLLVGHKTHNYMENMLLLESARAEGFTDVIRLNAAGQLTETSVGNVFFIQGDTLYTPALATGILPGVVRSVVIEAAQLLDIEVVEGAFTSSLLQVMDAAFVTNSLVGIQAVDTVAVDGVARNVDSATNSMVLDLKEALVAVEVDGAIDIG